MSNFYGLSFSGFAINLSLIVPRNSGKRANPISPKKMYRLYYYMLYIAVPPFQESVYFPPIPLHYARDTLLKAAPGQMARYESWTWPLLFVHSVHLSREIF